MSAINPGFSHRAKPLTLNDSAWLRHTLVIISC